MGWKKAEEIVVLPSAVYNASQNVDLNEWAAQWDEVMFIVDVTADNGTTLDVVYQVKGVGANWADHITLAQISGVGTFLLLVPTNAGVESRLGITLVGTDFTYSIRGVGKNAGGR